MSCEQMIQYHHQTSQTAARTSVITGSTAAAAAITTDPYVFTEPPSIQTLQFHKAAANGPSISAINSTAEKKGSPATSTTTTHRPLPRHNVNESLKKKLGIAHVKPVTAAPACTSPMISGVRTTKRSTAGVNNSRFGDFCEKISNNNSSGDSLSRTNGSGGGGGRKSASAKKTTAPKRSRETAAKKGNNNNNSSREANLKGRESSSQQSSKLSIAAASSDDFWYFGLRELKEDPLAPLYIRNWFIPEIAVSPCPVAVPSAGGAGAAAAKGKGGDLNNSPMVTLLSRDERLELKRNELRRRTIQLRNGQRLRDFGNARRRFLQVQELLQMQENGGVKVKEEPLEDENGESCARLVAGNYSNETRVGRVNSQSAGQREALIGGGGGVGRMDMQQVRVKKEEKKRKNVKEIKQQQQGGTMTVVEMRPKKMEKLGGGGSVILPVPATMIPVQPMMTTSVAVAKKRISNGNNLMKRSTVPVVKASAMPKRTVVVREAPLPATVTTILPRKNVYLKNGAPIPVQMVQQPRNPEIFSRYTKQQQHRIVDDFVEEEDDSVGLEEDVVEEEEEDEDYDMEVECEEDSLLNKRPKKKVPASSYVGKWKNYRTVTATTPKGMANAAGGGAVTAATDLLLVSENSSAYESSEDTGVGGLSESEMIEEIGFDSQFLEDPEFNNVLEDLLAVEQHGEMFDAISVDDDVKTMEMTGTSTFLGDFLADQMLRDSDGGGNGGGMVHYVHGGDATKPATALIQT